MEEIIEVCNITRFLTKQNVQKDMQIEILKYYKTLQNKKEYMILRLKGAGDYCEIIPYGPIENINLTNFYIFIDRKSQENWSGAWVEYIDKYKIEIILYPRTDADNQTYYTKDLLKILKEKGKIQTTDFPFNEIFDIKNPDEPIYLTIENIELKN